ncbi:MAG: cyclopropane-fatty-acyl-phospholipid synthase family protein [Acidobacteriota bacterium]
MSSVASLAERATTPRWGRQLARRLVLGNLRQLQQGQLRLVEDEQETLLGAPVPDLSVPTVEVRDPGFFAEIAFGGAIGAAEAFMRGAWTTDDLTTVVRVLVRNQAQRDGLERGWARLAVPLRLLFHLSRANTRRGSRRNIEAHYDLGNEFFALFLDRSLMYSSAVFDTPEVTLEEASFAKLERICRKLDLQPDDHVLEIGTGWGGFAEHAASRYGCRVTTTTISPAQERYARQRTADAGLAERVEILDRDYRDLEGRYDKLVSIEMIEAVGLDHLDDFFRVASERLRPEGLMLLQSITIADRYYAQAKRSVDFIKRYIFPGGGLPSIQALTHAATHSSDLTVTHLEDIGLDYAETLRRWRRRFVRNLDAVRQLGFSERFLRMWEYYFCYCEGAFRERSISDVQMLFAGPGRRQAPPR